MAQPRHTTVSYSFAEGVAGPALKATIPTDPRPSGIVISEAKNLLLDLVARAFRPLQFDDPQDRQDAMDRDALGALGLTPSDLENEDEANGMWSEIARDIDGATPGQLAGMVAEYLGDHDLAAELETHMEKAGATGAARIGVTDEEIAASRAAAVQGLIDQGITDPAEMAELLNGGPDGGDFTTDEIADMLGEADPAEPPPPLRVGVPEGADIDETAFANRPLETAEEVAEWDEAAAPEAAVAPRAHVGELPADATDEERAAYEDERRRREERLGRQMAATATKAGKIIATSKDRYRAGAKSAVRKSADDAFARTAWGSAYASYVEELENEGVLTRTPWAAGDDIMDFVPEIPTDFQAEIDKALAAIAAANDGKSLEDLHALLLKMEEAGDLDKYAPETDEDTFGRMMANWSAGAGTGAWEYGDKFKDSVKMPNVLGMTGYYEDPAARPELADYLAEDTDGEADGEPEKTAGAGLDGLAEELTRAAGKATKAWGARFAKAWPTAIEVTMPAKSREEAQADVDAQRDQDGFIDGWVIGDGSLKPFRSQSFYEDEASFGPVGTVSGDMRRVVVPPAIARKLGLEGSPAAEHKSDGVVYLPQTDRVYGYNWNKDRSGKSLDIETFESADEDEVDTHRAERMAEGFSVSPVELRYRPRHKGMKMDAKKAKELWPTDKAERLFGDANEAALGVKDKATRADIIGDLRYGFVRLDALYVMNAAQNLQDAGLTEAADMAEALAVEIEEYTGADASESVSWRRMRGEDGRDSSAQEDFVREASAKRKSVAKAKATLRRAVQPAATKAKLGSFWVVTEPSDISTIGDIVYETDARGLILQAKGGLEPKDIVDVFTTEEEAVALGRRLMGRMGKDKKSRAVSTVRGGESRKWADLKRDYLRKRAESAKGDGEKSVKGQREAGKIGRAWATFKETVLGTISGATGGEGVDKAMAVLNSMEASFSELHQLGMSLKSAKGHGPSLRERGLKWVGNIHADSEAERALKDSGLHIVWDSLGGPLADAYVSVADFDEAVEILRGTTNPEDEPPEDFKSVKATKECRRCGKMMDAAAEQCPACGMDVPDDQNASAPVVRMTMSAKDISRKAEKKDCPECGGQVLADAASCPHCGYDFTKEQAKSAKNAMVGGDLANEQVTALHEAASEWYADEPNGTTAAILDGGKYDDPIREVLGIEPRGPIPGEAWRIVRGVYEALAEDHREKSADRKCPDCGSMMKATKDGYVCKCGYDRATNAVGKSAPYRVSALPALEAAAAGRSLLRALVAGGVRESNAAVVAISDKLDDIERLAGSLAGSTKETLRTKPGAVTVESFAALLRSAWTNLERGRATSSAEVRLAADTIRALVGEVDAMTPRLRAAAAEVL